MLVDNIFAAVPVDGSTISSVKIAKSLDISLILAEAHLNRLKDSGAIGSYVEGGISFFYRRRIL